MISTLAAIPADAVDEITDLDQATPRQKRKLVRHSSRFLAQWWPDEYNDDYVRTHRPDVEKAASAALEQELAVGFVGVIPFLISAVLSGVVSWLVRLLLDKLFTKDNGGYQTIKAARAADQNSKA